MADSASVDALAFAFFFRHGLLLDSPYGFLPRWGASRGLRRVSGSRWSFLFKGRAYSGRTLFLLMFESTRVLLVRRPVVKREVHGAMSW